MLELLEMTEPTNVRLAPQTLQTLSIQNVYLQLVAVLAITVIQVTSSVLIVLQTMPIQTIRHV